MLGTTLLLIADRPEAEERGRSRLEEAWGHLAQTQRPKVRSVAAEDLKNQPQTLGSVSAAWLLLEEAEAEATEFAVCGLLHEHHIPLAVSRPEGTNGRPGEMFEPGLVACPLHAEPAAIDAVLSTLLSGASLFQPVRSEVKLLRAQSSGMAGQFDKIDEELRMALKIQREFLPKQVPEIDGLAFDVLWRPASYVGGDIYDVMRLDEHHVGVFIADAVGHGVPAALMTIYIKQSMTFREITPGIGPGYRIVPPGEAIAGLNRAMIEQDAGSASLGTAAYGVINTQTQRLTVARAGHPAPLLLRGDGRTQWLEPDGAMLGIFPEEVFEELTFDLDDGDRLLLYSDGFEVAFPGCDKTGRLANEHYASEFEGLRAGSGEQALEFLQGRLDLQSGSLNQRDDLTVVSTSVRARANVAAIRAAADESHDRRAVA
jgi:sigma-B regulation protein RsbU (phosphoserine phosphatase)